MKEFGIQVGGLIILILIGIIVTRVLAGGSPNSPIMFGSSGQQSNPQTGGTKVAIISSDGTTTKATLNVEIADTAEERGLGLGGRPSLDPNSGMVFVFPEPGNYNFWMKGMEFPLDFIWISSDRIVGLSENVPPPSPNQQTLPLYHANSPVDKVLEVNAGFVKAHNIQMGDVLRVIS
jgi:uncharacterized membrane protein (UPF0127 family)